MTKSLTMKAKMRKMTIHAFWTLQRPPSPQKISLKHFLTVQLSTGHLKCATTLNFVFVHVQVIPDHGGKKLYLHWWWSWMQGNCHDPSRTIETLENWSWFYSYSHFHLSSNIKLDAAATSSKQIWLWLNIIMLHLIIKFGIRIICLLLSWSPYVYGSVINKS